MEKKRFRIKKYRKNRLKEVVVKRLECGNYEVYFDFINVPIKMSLAYLSRLVSNNHIGVKEVLR